MLMASESDKIQAKVNGENRGISKGLSISKFLESLDLNPLLVVVELNAVIISRERFSEIEICEGDQVELVHFVGGG
jgi:sulfur carrier protein